MITTEDCWLFVGSKDQYGYGTVHVKENGLWRRKRAHRVSYESFVGEIPEGLVLDHLCRVTSCINPDHLEPVTSVENTMRGEGPMAKNARKTHCPQGHEYNEENLSKCVTPGRRCKPCNNIRRKRDYRLQKLAMAT